MKEITKLMINEYKIMKLGYDFMGYKVERKTDLSFHHLIVAHRDCKILGLGEGYDRRNGAILVQNTSHDYLHLIEQIDLDIFNYISSEMIDENIKGKLDIENLIKIRNLLLRFEREHDHDTNKKGQLLIKRNYIDKRIIL